MANAEHLEKILSGGATWNDWRRQNPAVVPDLSGADLSGHDLRRADLTATDLSHADLRHAELDTKKLFRADLQFANLTDAGGLRRILASGARNVVLAYYSAGTLSEINIATKGIKLDANHNDRLNARDLSRYACPGLNFGGARLSHFDLSDAVLRDCSFEGADLGGSKMLRSDLRWSNLERANLSGCLLQ